MADLDYSSYQSEEKIFNTAQLSILRINRLLIDCNNNSRYTVFNPVHLTYWKANIEALFREIAAYMRDQKSKDEIKWKEEYNKHNIYKKSVRTKHAAFVTAFNNRPMGKDYLPPEAEELYDLLDEWEIMLRVSLDKRGLLIPNKQDSGAAILNR